MHRVRGKAILPKLVCLTSKPMPFNHCTIFTSRWSFYICEKFLLNLGHPARSIKWNIITAFFFTRKQWKNSILYHVLPSGLNTEILSSLCTEALRLSVMRATFITSCLWFSFARRNAYFSCILKNARGPNCDYFKNKTNDFLSVHYRTSTLLRKILGLLISLYNSFSTKQIFPVFELSLPSFSNNIWYAL